MPAQRGTCMRSSALAIVLILSLSPARAFGQNPPPPPQDPQKPPAPVGEEGKNPTRVFMSSLGHNLKDDVKHLPRLNTLYVLAVGGSAALAVHPFEANIKQTFAGTGFSQQILSYVLR